MYYNSPKKVERRTLHLFLFKVTIIKSFILTMIRMTTCMNKTNRIITRF